MIERAVAAVAPWQDLYSASKVLPTMVVSLHLSALLVGGGLAIASDRTTLRAARATADDRRRQLGELGAVHRPVLIALPVLFLSGLALAAADLETYLASPVYWIKFGFITLFLANGLVMTRTESLLSRSVEQESPRVPLLWRRLRRAALSSIALWIITLVLGATLVNAA